jgi:hypothetical protein
MDLTEYRKKILIELKETVVRKGVTVYRDEIKGHIEFTGKGIQECINQPIYNDTNLYLEKMELLERNLRSSLEEAEYVGFSEYQTHPKPHILGYHYFRTKTKSGSSLYFNVQLTVQKKLVLYSITQIIREL